MHTGEVLRILKNICEDFKSVGGACSALIEKYRGDEAEFKMTVSDAEKIEVPLGQAAVALASRPAALQTIAQQVAKTKVLQYQRSYAVLLRGPEGNFLSW